MTAGYRWIYIYQCGPAYGGGLVPMALPHLLDNPTSTDGMKGAYTDSGNGLGHVG